MKANYRIILSGIFLLVTAGAGGLVRAADHQHSSHEEHGQAKLQFDQGKKWETDAPLRQAMDILRATFAERLADIHKGRLAVDQYKVLGAKVDTEVSNIVAQCKLEPKADAMLHIVVADLLAAAEVMQGKAPGKPAAAAHKAVTAVNAYGRYFDHPKWQPLK